MALEDVESPPYPGEGATAQGMFNSLKDLRKWVLFYRDDSNAAIGREVVPAVIEIPNKSAYIMQPVYTQYRHMMFMRHMREQWDHLIRLYERDWTCQTCVQARTLILSSAAVLLNGAFTPYEVREAHGARLLENVQQTFERLSEHFKKVMQPLARETPEQ